MEKKKTMYFVSFPHPIFLFIFSKLIWDRFCRCRATNSTNLRINTRQSVSVLLFICHSSIHCSMLTSKKTSRTEKKKKKLTTPFNRYNSSKRFPLFELGTGVSIESSSLSFSFSSEDDDIIIFFPFVYFCCVLLTIYFM